MVVSLKEFQSAVLVELASRSLWAAIAEAEGTAHCEALREES